MFYLHFMDGDRVHRGSVIAITESDTVPVIEHNVGGSKLVDENGVPETFDNGWKLGPLDSTHYAKNIALAIAREINCKVLVGGKVIEPTESVTEMTVTQAAGYAREVGESVTGRAIRKAAKNGHIPGARKIGGAGWVIPYDGFNNYLDNRPHPGPPA